MKLLISLAVAASLVAGHGHHDNATHHHHDHEHCGTHVEEGEEAEATRIGEAFVRKVCSQKSLQDLRLCWPAAKRAATPVTINVWYHIIHSGTTGRLTEGQVQAQFEQTNKDFLGLENPSIPGAAAMDITFRLAGTTYTDNPQWFNNIDSAETAIKTALAVDNTRNFNQYFGNFNAGLLGFCYFPNSFAESSFRHGCMNLYSSVPGGSSTNYNQGKTTTHETGHGIGLFHTFQGGCNGGDQVEDTCPQSSPTNGCPANAPRSCGLSCQDPINNYMDYSFDRCMTQFTPGQNTRANTQLSTFRPSLYLGPEAVELIESVLPGAWDEAREFQRISEERYVARRKALGKN